MDPFSGSSSFFLYDLEDLDRRLETLKRDLGSHAKLFYAMKANSLSSLLEIIHSHGIGFDFASGGELSQLNSIRVDLASCLATGPAKSKDYLAKLLRQGCATIVLESLNQLKWLNELCAESGTNCKALLRIQLEWNEISEKSVLGGDQITPFGLHPDDWSEIDLKDYPDIKVQGVHCFQWGNVLNIDRLAEIWTACAGAAQKFADKMGFELRVLDLGGGLGVDYSDKAELDSAAVGALLARIKDQFSISELWLELGRYLVADCGKFYSRVVDFKSVRGQNILVLQSGINNLLRPALTGSSFPVRPLKSESEATSSGEKVRITGPLCTALDVLGELSLNNVEIGDWIEFSKVGAYGFSESMPFFLGHDVPAEFVKHSGEIKQIRNYLSAEDYLK